jgi:hypothetical protein
MILFWRLVIGLVGLFNIAIGLMFLVHPRELAAMFFLEPLGTQGLATIRADFPAFFLTGGLFALLGAIRAERAPLAVPMMLLAIALAGRTLSLVVDGAPQTAFQPMAAEAIMVLLLALASMAFPARRT